MGLFDGLLAKLRYTGDAVNDIGEAANEKGAGIDLLATPLAQWAAFIRRNIKSAGQFSGFQTSVNVVKPTVIAIDYTYAPPQYSEEFPIYKEGEELV